VCEGVAATEEGKTKRNEGSGATRVTTEGRGGGWCLVGEEMSWERVGEEMSWERVGEEMLSRGREHEYGKLTIKNNSRRKKHARI
jgi:hypothetical protein